MKATHLRPAKLCFALKSMKTRAGPSTDCCKTPIWSVRLNRLYGRAVSSQAAGAAIVLHNPRRSTVVVVPSLKRSAVERERKLRPMEIKSCKKLVHFSTDLRSLSFSGSSRGKCENSSGGTYFPIQFSIYSNSGQQKHFTAIALNLRASFTCTYTCSAIIGGAEVR